MDLIKKKRSLFQSNDEQRLNIMICFLLKFIKIHLFKTLKIHCLLKI
jgi:hypothetical protein